MKEAKKFNDDFHRTFGFQMGQPDYSPQYYAANVWAGNPNTPLLIAVGYVERGVPSFEENVKAPVHVTIKMYYLEYSQHGTQYTPENYPCT